VEIKIQSHLKVAAEMKQVVRLPTFLFRVRDVVETKPSAFSLIEMLGVVTVLAILALALTPILIKQYDRMAGEKETAQLRSFAEAFRQGIRNANPKYIPNETTWAQFIAANAGVSTDQVLKNDRRIARLLLIDENFLIGGSLGLRTPYTNLASGTVLPQNPRLMIVSSISRPVTDLLTGLTLASGMVPFTAFDNIWKTPERGVPAGVSTAWANKGEDLKIQRINLADLFVGVTLNTDVFSQPGRYSIDGGVTNDVPQIPPNETNTWTRYFLDSTVLDLISRSDRLQYREVLHRSKSFTYSVGSWQGDKFLAKSIGEPGASELEQASLLFRGVTIPPCAGATTLQVFDAMYRYMSNYVGWCKFNNCAFSANKPSGSYGIQLDAAKTVPGSQAYLDDRTALLICPPQGGGP
jgi:type II secretory pathway pseudopilin PulG